MKDKLKPKHFLIFLSCALALTLFACGGGDSTPASKPPPAAQAPSIAAQPADQAVAAGQTATFTVGAAGTSPLTYQWQKSGAAIGAANGASYTTPAAALTDSGAVFSVVVSNTAGSVTSRSAKLTVTAAAGGAPAITTQPAPQTIVAGQTATFSVTATGAAPLTYQWQKNGAAISTATLSTYTTPVVAAADSGALYRVVVTNPSGNVTSSTALLTVAAAPPPGSGTDVVTYKNDLARTGQNLTEKILTPANVSYTKFGLLRTLTVDGKVDAQPLYLSQLLIGTTAHNVVFTATENDSAYAFDSDTGAVLWKVSLLLTGEVQSDSRSCDQIVPQIGVTSTPVIDRSAGAHGAIYVVAMSKDASGNYHQRLHALDVTSGAELFAGPKEITASYAVNGGGTTTFDPSQYEERSALLLLNGVVYTTWTSHCDSNPYTGWIIGYDETSLVQKSVLNIAPNSAGGGPAIWMAGGGPAADSSGNIYLLAANGVFETTLDANGFPSLGDYGNSFLKIATTGQTPSVADYFTMFNEVAESAADTDLGSGGEMLLPDLTDSTNTVRHLAIGAGKDTNIYIVNRDSMGKFNAANNSQVWQELPGALPGGVWATPAYFNGTVYYADVGGTLKAFAVVNAKLIATPSSQSTKAFTYPGTAPVVSANGTSNGIIWTHENINPAVLHAYDATNLANELYNSNQATNGRDHFGVNNRFISPSVADGKVFVGTQTTVAVFGLLP